MTLRRFGVLADGRPVEAAEIGGAGGLRVEVLSFGATVRRVCVPTAAGDLAVTTTLPDLAAYEGSTSYHGGLVGRCANRIGGARFTLDGRDVRVTANEGVNCLHGGAVGWNRRLWTFTHASETSMTLTYASFDGEEGFPGAVEASVELSVSDPWTLDVVYTARSDAPTPVNLTHHFYFNLSGDAGGAGDIRDHEVTIAAAAVTSVGPGLIPTGEILPVEGTPFDFRTARALGEGLAQDPARLAPAGGYDHNWALSPGGTPALRLRSPRSGVALQVQTDQPGLQMYGGQGMAAPFHPFAAVVLELQGWPDAVNHAAFPAVVLRPGQVYRRRSSYWFEAGAPG